MSSGMSYIDTCGVVMLVNRDDELRKKYHLKSKKAEDCIPKNHDGFLVPMPALGEAFHIIRERCHEDCDSTLHEINRLLDQRFLDITFIHDAYSTFMLARDISSDDDDDRDKISPMDALIIAVAATDNDCNVFYTSDKKLQYNQNVADLVNDWRITHGMDCLKIADLSEIVR